MRERKLTREIKRMRRMTLAELLKEARRNARLRKNALHCAFRSAYATRKMLGRVYGAEIARRLSEK